MATSFRVIQEVMVIVGGMVEVVLEEEVVVAALEVVDQEEVVVLKLLEVMRSGGEGMESEPGTFACTTTIINIQQPTPHHH